MAVVSSLTFFTILLLTSSGSIADDANDKLASAMNNFGINMYKELIKNNDNLFCSGFSLSVLLNMLLTGARTDTATEISNTLGHNEIGLSESEIENSIHNMLTELRDNGSDYELDIANSVWIHKTFSVLPEFRSKLVETYYAEEDEVTFGTAEATNKINSWVSRSTKGNIPKLFDEPLDGLVRLVLVNAMYFNGTWKTKFDKTLTGNHPFHYNNGESTKDVKMMNIVKNFRYTDSADLNSQVLELPYEGDEVSMVVVLPHENNGLSDMEKELTFGKLKTALDDLEKAKVHVKFPKFKSSSDLPLVDVLRDMGIQKAFSEGVADLSGIDGSHELYVSQAIQKAVVEVSEEGTIASVASGASASIRTLPVQLKEVYFTADHPFIYFIRYHPRNLVLFMGRYVKP